MPDVMKTVGRYEILRELGRGGMALVYLARQTDLDRFVALKELGAFHASDASFAQRFLRESRVAGSLSHPNIVTVHDYFEHDGTPYIAMEYVERGSLRAYVGRMTLAQIGGVLEGLLAGLTNAEQNGIVHRDLKPENLMVTADGRVKIADFGIAKATTKMQTGAFLTATGTTVGTPTYMAPEQAMAQDIGPWTDLYSVGCMAFEMFTGKVPFHDSDAPMAILLRHVNEPIAPVKSIDASVDQGISDWIEKLLVKDPKQRTQSAADAWDELEEIVIGLLGPRWRRSARLMERAESVDTPNPLTPAPFQGTGSGASASDEFQSFAWGQPAAETGAPPAAPAPYTPPPQDLPPGPMEEAPAPEAPPAPAPEPEVSTPEPGAPAAPEPEAPSDEPDAETGFVTFGAPAPPPPTDALIPPPTPDAPEDAAPPADAAPADAAPPAVTPPPSEAVPEPEPEPDASEPAPKDSGFETYVAPPPPRPPAEDPGTDALRGLTDPAAAPAPEPVAPEPEPEPEPEPAAAAPEPVAPPPPTPEPPARDPEPAAAPDLGATVMPEALRRQAEASAAEAPAKERKPKAPKTPKPPKERKPKAVKPPKERRPKAVKPAPEPGARSKTFPIALAAGALVAVVVGFALGGSGGGDGGSTQNAASSGALNVTADAGAASVKVPAGWSKVGSAPDIPGLSLEQPVAYAKGGRDGGEAIVVGNGKQAASNPTLLALPFLQGLEEVPDPTPVELGDGVQAYRYSGLRPNGFDRAVTVYAAPTSDGVATVACLTSPDGVEAFAATCDQVANTVRLGGGAEAGALGPSKDYAAAVSKALGRLSKSDKSGTAKLASAKTHKAQASAARSLSAAFNEAGKALARADVRPADKNANAALVKGLRSTGGAYSKLAAAASRNNRSAYNKARSNVAAGRKAIAGALANLKTAGYGVAG